MGSEVSYTSLAEICCDVSYGYTESATSEAVGPKFLRITDIQGGTLDWNKVPYCPATDANTKKYALEIGDIVIARTGNSTGENAQLSTKPPPAVFASYLIRFRPDASRVNPFFVGYQLRSERFRQYVLAVRSGSAQPGANAKQLGAFTVELIDRALQDEAVEILRALDDRITLLRETNATLEAIAQALFKSWFVDFDPVRAKAEGRQPEGMDAATAALFPDSFEDSELGLVPKGWKIASLGSQCSLEWGNTTITKKSYVENGVKAYSAAGQDGFVEKAERSGIGSVISAIGTVGNVHLAFEDWTAIKNTLTAQCDSDEESSYIHFLLGNIDFPSRGSTQQFISLGDARGLKVIYPSIDSKLAFGDIAFSLIRRIIENQKQAKTLTHLRDTLLPRLISGQLRLPDTEATLRNMDIP